MYVYSELIQAQAENLASDPTPGKKGRIYHKSTTEPLKVDDGTTLHNVLTDQMYSDIKTQILALLAAGDISLSKTTYKTAYIYDEKTNADTGGTPPSINTWLTRDLNTESDPDSIVSIASNQFTLAAGTYEIDASAPGFNCGSHKIKLRNVTDSSDVSFGTMEYSGTDSQSRSVLKCTVTIAGSKAFSIMHMVTNAGTFGFGRGALSASIGTPIYTTVKITKLY